MAYDQKLDLLRSNMLAILGLSSSTMAMPDLWTKYLDTMGVLPGVLAERQVRAAAQNGIPVGDYQNGNLFTPQSLFAAGEVGAWYDPSDFNSMYQDSAGTTPVTALEQSVGLMLDKSRGLVRGAEQALGGYATTNTFDNVTTTLSNTSFQQTGGTTASRSHINVTAAAGVLVEVTARVVSISVGTMTAFGRNSPDGGGTTLASSAATAAGQVLRFAFVATGVAQSVMFVTGNAGASTVVDSISIRTCPGNHASQATAASRPVLSARVNKLPCSDPLTAVVGVLGSGGAMPTGWGWTAVAGITKEVVGKGTLPDGTTYVDLRCYGTNGTGAIAYQDIYFVSSPAIASVNGQTWSGAVTGQIVAGDGAAGFSGAHSMQLAELTLGTYGGGTSSGALTAAAMSRVTASRTLNVVGTDNVRMFLNASVAIGGTVDCTFRLAMPQVELGPTATRYQRVTTATDYDSHGFPRYLRFDGVDDYLTMSSVPFLPTDDSAAMYSYAWNGKTGDHPVVTLRDVAGTALCRYGSATATVDTFLRDDAGVFSRVLNLPITGGVPASVVHTRAAGVSTQRKNAVDGPTESTALGVSTIATGRIGSDAGGSLYADICVHGIVLRKGTLSNAYKLSTERFLAGKAGVVL